MSKIDHIRFQGLALKANHRQLDRLLAPIFLLIWLLINIITASQVELYSDEAYYWLFSRFLDWGYFDHPPMIALMIKAGSVLGHSEMGVRLVPILLLSAAIWLTYRLSNPVQPLTFFASVFGMFSLNLVGFLALPDIPMIFFGVLFLVVFKWFLESPRRLIPGILLGLSMAALLYSKYHGILIIGFAIASNWRILKDKHFWLAAATGLVAFLPHLVWQVQHSFPSFQYHLVDRSSNYRLIFTTEYVFANLLFHGPWVSIVLFYCGIKHNTKTDFERALKFIMVGTFAFFFFMTFKGRVEPNWTLFGVIPMLILGLKYISLKKALCKTYLQVCGVFVVLVLLVRIHIISPFYDFPGDRVWEFHEKRAFVEEVFTRANGMKVVANKYQRASILSFYGQGHQEFVPALNINSRSNQFTLWAFDSLVGCQNVLFVSSNHTPDSLLWNHEYKLYSDVVYRPCERDSIPNRNTQDLYFIQ